MDAKQVQQTAPLSSKDTSPRLTGLKKRQQIEVAGRVMFIWIAIAAAALSFCAATGQYLFTKWQHNNKVLGAKQQAAETLKKNITNAQALTKEVDALVANEALASVKTNGADHNTKSVLDALPLTAEPAALATSLQQAILNRSGVVPESLSVPQESETPSSFVSTPQEMSFSFVIAGTYDQIKTAILDLERTIRPMKINSISLAGSDKNLRANVSAVTYFQEPKKVIVDQEVIK